ncbi:MAG TPA: hypothetical protein VFS21_40160 [Roseiflexaceae bacterium]|nr:hypothetical protein [Roseiflexaceae bacterium]
MPISILILTFLLLIFVFSFVLLLINKYTKLKRISGSDLYILISLLSLLFFTYIISGDMFGLRDSRSGNASTVTPIPNSITETPTIKPIIVPSPQLTATVEPPTITSIVNPTLVTIQPTVTSVTLPNIQIDTGDIRIGYPQSMIINQSYVITMEILPQNMPVPTIPVILEPASSSNQTVITSSIVLYPVLFAHLKANGFNLEPENETARDYIPGRSMFWSWTIVPNNLGEHTLAIELSGARTRDDTNKEIILLRGLNVTVSDTNFLAKDNFLSAILAAIIGAIALILAAIIPLLILNARKVDELEHRNKNLEQNKKTIEIEKIYSDINQIKQDINSIYSNINRTTDEKSIAKDPVIPKAKNKSKPFITSLAHHVKRKK